MRRSSPPSPRRFCAISVPEFGRLRGFTSPSPNLNAPAKFVGWYYNINKFSFYRKREGEVSVERENLSMSFRLEVPRALYSAMLEQARAELPNECCGLLAGTVEEGVGRV